MIAGIPVARSVADRLQWAPKLGFATRSLFPDKTCSKVFNNVQVFDTPQVVNCFKVESDARWCWCCLYVVE